MDAKGIDDAARLGIPTRLLEGAEAEAEIARCLNGNGRKEEEPGPTDWEPPIPFYEFERPPFPTGVLPPWLARFVEAEAVATQTPPDLCALLCLSALALALAKRFVVQVRPGWEEPLNLWTLTVTRPGTRSTQVFRDVAAPIEASEEARGLALRPEIAAAKARHEIAEKRAEKARTDAARDKDGSEALTEAAVLLAQEAAKLRVPSEPRLLADDISPEKLASLLAEQEGRIAILSPEGGIFEQMGGRYSQSGLPNLDVYLKSHAGDTLRVDRVGRSPEFVRDPALTLGLRIQPEVMNSLASKPSFRGRGLLARFLYALPEDPLGKRDVNPPSMPAEIRETYQRHMETLLKIDPTREGEPGPRVVTLSPAAVELLHGFMARLEPRLGEWGDLASMTDWAGKLAGLIVRIAGALHLASNVENPERWLEGVNSFTLDCARKIGEYALPHARMAFAQMGADPVIEDAKHLLRWIERHRHEEFKKRDCWQQMKSRYERMVQMEPGFSLLIEHGFIREKVEEGPRGPGRPSHVFQVNPLRQKPQKPQNPGIDDTQETQERSHQ